MDLTKYRTLFIEEATEHLAEMSKALLRLEKECADAEAIDLIFRMAHGIKGMAASLEYGSITEVAHRLEDRMSTIRAAGRTASGEETALLFRGLEALEAMVGVVRQTGEAPPDDFALAESFCDANASLDPPDPDAAPEEAPDAAPDEAPKKKSPEPVGETSPASPTAPSPDPDPEFPEAPAPPPSLRVNTETLDRFLGTVGEVILSSSQLRTSAADNAPPAVSVGLDRMDRAVGDLQRRALELRTTPLLRIVEPLPRMVREIAQRLGKRVEVEVRNAEIELDRSILDRLSDPLVHMFRNAVDHGIEVPAVRVAAGKPEVGTIVVDARREKDLIHITVSDDGAGIDLDSLRSRAVNAGVVVSDIAEDLPAEEVAAFIFQPGVSTATAVSDVSGRGVGMDAVRATVEALGGHVELTTERGRGTTMTLVVPITAAVQRVLLVGIGTHIAAIPIAKVERILEIAQDEIERTGYDAFTLVDDDPLPVIDLGRHLAFERGDGRSRAVLILAEIHGEVMALEVDSIVGQQQIYVKPVPAMLASRKVLTGLTLLGEGRPVFLLDINQLS